MGGKKMKTSTAAGGGLGDAGTAGMTAIGLGVAKEAAEKHKKKYKSMCKKGALCGCIMILFFAIGILLLVFFGDFISDKRNKGKQAGGIIGLILLIIGLFGIIVAIITLVCVYKIIKRIDARASGDMPRFEHKRGQDGSYWPGVDYPRQTYGSVPTAPSDDQSENSN